MRGQKYGQKMVKPLRIEKNKNGKTRSRNSIVLDGWEELTLWIRMIKIRKKLSKLRGENRKDLWTGDHSIKKTKHQLKERKRKVEQLSNVDYVPTNTHSSPGESQLYISEDNEVVIKMVIKRRSPTMRHVSRLHRVALEWLFDRINVEPKIQIKYVDTKNQLADMLTEGSFTRDEWNHLLRLFNTMSFSMFSCSHFSNFLSDPIGKQSAMSKRGQEATSSEGSPKAKPKTMVPAKTRPVNLVLRSPWSARVNPPQDLGYLVDSVNADEGQVSQTCARKLVRTTRSPEVESSEVRRQEKLRRMFVSSSMKAAIHLGPNYLANLEVYKNTNFEDIQSLFNITQKLILEHSEEILNVNTIHSTSPFWTRSVLSHDQMIQWTKAKVLVYSDSVLCLGPKKNE